MSSTRLQLMKWTVPAFALILGLLWYKRRRADRADPGGMSKSNGSSQARTSKASLNLYDSGIHIDDSFTLKTPVSAQKEIVCSEKKVSENLAIPARKPASQPISVKSTKSVFSGNQPWYLDVKSSADMEEIPSLVSNNRPKSPKLQSLPKGRPKCSFEAAKDDVDGKITEILNSNNEQSVSTSRPKSLTSNAAKDSVRNEMCEMLENAKKPAATVSDIQAGAASERDSANHSPVSGVLEGSVSDEARSEGSSDSGKGGSINGNHKEINPTVYEFVVSQNLVGRLIGRHGNFLHNIRTKAKVNILIKRHPTTKEMKVCAIEGSQQGIDMALDMIRQKFPEKKFPSLTLEQVSFLRNPEEIPWLPEVMQLSLIEGVNNDVMVCNVVQPNHFILHLPTHPSYPSLRILDENMTQLYNTTTDAPPVPDRLKKGMIFVAKWYDRWVRVFVEKPDPEGEMNLVRLVDHGGLWTFKNSEMRKIRNDYLTLPFQAIEVFLANVQPRDGEWKQEAYEVVAQICHGVVAQAQIQAYIDYSTHINLYINIQNHGVISLADELIARGYAEPIQMEELGAEDQ